MPISWRERVDTASAIKGILDSYPGNSIIRELLQNSDDARATKQVFVLDPRQHGTETLVDEALKGSQGPALLAMNNSVFTESDWEAVRTIHGSNKTSDESKTGKYGLGLRACYHITDNLHILSGNKLVIFDPHEKFAPPHDGGVSISIEEEQHRYKDQLSAFGAVVPDPEVTSYQQLTVVRLPLRTAAQAKESRIKPIPASMHDMQQLYIAFVNNELRVALLFLKHVLSIELRWVDADGNEATFATVEVVNRDVTEKRSFMKGNAALSETYQLDIKWRVGSRPFVLEKWRILHDITAECHVQELMIDRLGYDIGDCLRRDKLSSHVAVAFPLSSPKESIRGRLFTLLPLPIITNFPLHIHGIFALTPDRQSLRNPEELGIGLESRERFLVEWNRVTFEEFIPKVWLKLLEVLITQDDFMDIWSAWPPEQVSMPFWGSLLNNFTKLALSEFSSATIFPDIFGSFISRCSSALLASESEDKDLLEAVARADIPILRPPAYIYHCIDRVGPIESHFLSFDAPNLRTMLLSHIDGLHSLKDNGKDKILDYLVLQSPRDIDYALGLPLIPLDDTDANRVSLSRYSNSTSTYVIATFDEAFLFSRCDEQMIPLYRMSARVCSRLQNAAKNRSANVAALGSNHLAQYLNTLFGTLALESDEITDEMPVFKWWFIAFWRWIDESASVLFKTANIMSLHLLPTLDGHLRRIRSQVFLPIDTQDPLYATLKRSGVPFLDPCIKSTSTLHAHNVAILVEHIPSLINFISPSNLVNGIDRELLQDHVIASLQKSKVTLNSSQLSQFRKLPIFPTRVSSDKLPITSTVLAPAVGQLKYVNVGSDDFPLPVVEGTTFIDVSKSFGVLATVIDSKAISGALGEVQIMELAVRHISSQPDFLQHALLSRIIPRLFDLNESTRKLLREAKVIPVGASVKLAPFEIIDPMSSLANLFKDEENKFPAEPYSTPLFLFPMVAHGLLLSELTVEIVEERIRYITCTDSDQRRVQKAKDLLSLMANTWNPSFSHTLQSSLRWIPTTQNGLASRHDSRDVRVGETRYLFDLVLHEAISVRSDEVRSALGWSPHVEFDTLKLQVQRTLHAKTLGNRRERMIQLIKYIAFQHASEHLTSADLESLKAVIADELWVPVTTSELASVHHALLAEGLTISSSFRAVSPTLINDSACLQFLRLMGCVERPTMETLLRELSAAKYLRDVIDLLSEIATHGPLEEDQRRRILIPDCEGVLRSWSNIYFDDMAGHFNVTATDNDAVAAHHKISRDLARCLGLNFLSGMCIDEDEFDYEIDEDDMSENFITRIKTVLVDYDAQYSFNEFLANAADAGARVFKVWLDTRSFEARRILCNEMASFQQLPSILLHNNAMFSSDDFKGIRRIGEGGKTNVFGTIGKFGLGALSFYHFSDVAFIISGEFIMILDPTALFLPTRRGRRRCSLWYKLSDFRRKYSDHLMPFYDIAGFSRGMDSYPGTLIRLPLRQSASPLSETAMDIGRCRSLLMQPYYNLSRDAMYFTCLQEITAMHLDGLSEHFKTLWSVKKSLHRLAAENHSICILSLTSPYDIKPTTEVWLICQSRTPLSDLPPHFTQEDHPLHKLKLQEGIDTCLAFYLGHARHSLSLPERQYHLFSGLRLPEITSLPIHIHSAFAVSTDRRSIRFDLPDGAGQRVVQSEYNAWLLSHIVPPLYLVGLEQLFNILPSKTNNTLTPKTKFTDWWPRKPVGDISRQITEGFYSALPQYDRPVIPTVDGNLITAAEALFSNQEPEGVTQYLTRLKVPEFVVLSSSIKPLMPMQELQTLNPNRLVDVLSRPSIDAEVQKAFNPKRLLHVCEIDTVLQYVLDSPLCGGDRLRLLITKDNMFQCFNRHRLVYITSMEFPHDLFPLDRFLSDTYSPQTQELLLKSSEYPVQHLDAEAILAFIETRVGRRKNLAHHEPGVGEWIKLFWSHFANLCYLRVTLDTIADFPLFPTYDDRKYVSLSYCRSGNVLPAPQDHDLCEKLMPIIQSFNIPVLRHHPWLPEEQKFSFQGFLQCIHHCGISDNIFVQHEWLADWVQNQILDASLRDLQSNLLPVLARLPLWRATRGGHIQRLGINEMQILPFGVSLSQLQRFLDPYRAIAEYSSALIRLKSVLKTYETGTMTLDGFLSILRLPDSITSQDIPYFQYLITTMRDHFGWQGPMINGIQMRVPDGRLRLRPVQELFNDAVQIFSTAFRHSEDTMFMHRDLRNLQAYCGVVSVVTIDAFTQCARAIDGDVRQNHNDTLQRAAVIYDYYSNVLPSQIMSNIQQWRSMDNLRFIPRDTTGFQNLSYDPEPYLVPHHLIVSPNDLLLNEYLSIAWTQRARFLILPTQNLIAVYPTLGVPTAENVVAHLVVLTTKVATDHPNNRTLLRDLRSTYTWLQQHASEAKSALLSRSNERIFLNAADPDTDDLWEWRSANELVLNMRYNSTSNSRYAVESFMLEFRELLKAAGVKEQYDVVYEDEVEMGDADFEKLRKAGKMIDFHLRPEHIQPDEEDLSSLGAHAAFLAAKVPHMEMMLTGGWNENERKSVLFPGTYFGASAFLDLLYTGDIAIERPTDGENAMKLLQNLLEMLPVLDLWNLPSFKKKLSWLISSKYLFIDPETHDMIRKSAQEYNASDLVKACDDFVAKNPNWFEYM